MDFSTIPSTYLDQSNWHHQQHNYQSGNGGSNNSHLLQQQQQPPPPQPPGPPPPPQPHGGGAGSIRPGSMVDRARMANIPLPETSLKCPRCDSTNTKFCYFNNYSLTQPRHFCKTCRRYWTRGGALRNVPVGGGCRRNKRTKGSNSKSPASSGDIQSTTSASTSTTLALPISGTTTASMLGLTSQFPQLRFMAPLGQLSGEYGEIGLNYGGGSVGGGLSGHVGTTSEMNFQNLFGNSGGGGGGGGMEPWRLQQFPFMGGLDSTLGSGPAGLYHFQGSGGGGGGGGSGGDVSHSMINSQIGTIGSSVKMEDNNPNISRQFMGVNFISNIQGQGNISDQWRSSTNATTNPSGNVNAWTDLSGGFSSSSTSNPL